MKKVLQIILISLFSLTIISCASSSDDGASTTSDDTTTSDDDNTTTTTDTTAPTLAEVTAVTTPTNDTTPNYTFSSDEAGTITYGGNCTSSTTSATSGNNAISFSTLSEGTYIDCTIMVTDSGANVSSALTVSSFTIDTTAPSVNSFTLSDTALKAGDNATVTLVFSEAVASFSSAADITVANGTLATMTSADNVTWTGTFTPTANTEDDNNTLSLATSYTDTVGNSGTAATTLNYMVDDNNPSVSSFTLSDTALKTGDNATVTLVFSEAVASFSSSADITVANGTLATMTSADNITWAGTFTPTDNIEDASNTLYLAASWTDTVGNSGTAATTLNYAVDTTAPSISSVTAGWGTYLNATEDDSDGTVTVVTSLAENGQTVTVALNGTNYTGTVSDNSTSVTIAASGLQALTNGSSYTLTTNVSNAAGNAATENTGTSFTYDITAPTLAETTAVPSFTNDNSTQYTFSSSEGGTISVGGSCSSDNNTAVADNMTVSFAALADSTYSNCTITVTDSAGNSVTLDVNSFTIDTTAPILAEVTAVTTPTNDNTSSYTFSSTESGTISYSICGGNLDNASADNNTITFDALADDTYSDCKISVTDNASNTSDNLSVSSFTIDTVKPVLAQVTAVTTPTNDNTPSYVFSSNEAGTNSYGGSCGSTTTSATSASDNNTVILTQPGNSTALSDASYSNCTITVTDSAGNASTALSVNTFEVDATAPTFSSSSPSDNATGIAKNTSIAITLSEPINTSSVSVNTGSDNCDSFSLQVSGDDFENCVKMAGSPSISNSNATFSITPSDNLSPAVNYKFKLNDNISDVVGNTINTYTSEGFITEDISSWRFLDGNANMFQGMSSNCNIGEVNCAMYWSQIYGFNGKVYATWTQHDTHTGDSTRKIRVAEYQNDNVTWSFVDGGGYTGIRKCTTGHAQESKLIEYNNELYVGWAERHCTNTDDHNIRFAKWDNSSTWNFVDGNGADGINQDSGEDAQQLNVVVYNNNLYAIWRETKSASMTQIHVKKYNGSSWSSVDGNSTNGINYSSSVSASKPSIIVFKNELYASWIEDNKVRVTKYDNSTSWDFVDGNSSNGINKNSGHSANTVTLATDNSTLYASWSENNQIRSAKYNNDGSTWTFIDGNGTNGLNYNTSKNAFDLDSIVLSKYLYLIWMERYVDGQDNADQVRMRRYNGSSWTMIDGNNTTGINRNPTRQADSPRFAVYRSRIYATWPEFSVSRVIIGE
jgi:hypothetical protein